MAILGKLETCNLKTLKLDPIEIQELANSDANQHIYTYHLSRFVHPNLVGCKFEL
jgi:hypothetical protein